MTSGSFDLRGVSPPASYPSARRRGFLGMAMLVCIAGGLALLFVSFAVPKQPLASAEEDLFLALIFGIMAAYLALSAVYLRKPNASQLRLSDSGLTLTYPGRRDRALKWSDPAFRLEFTVYPDTEGSHLKAIERPARFGLPRMTWLDLAAWDALLTASKEHGLRVQESVPKGSTKSWVLIHR
jgi:hypothetical protein